MSSSTTRGTPPAFRVTERPSTRSLLRGRAQVRAARWPDRRAGDSDLPLSSHRAGHRAGRRHGRAAGTEYRAARREPRCPAHWALRRIRDVRADLGAAVFRRVSAGTRKVLGENTRLVQPHTHWSSVLGRLPSAISEV